MADRALFRLVMLAFAVLVQNERQTVGGGPERDKCQQMERATMHGGPFESLLYIQKPKSQPETALLRFWSACGSARGEGQKCQYDRWLFTVVRLSTLQLDTCGFSYVLHGRVVGREWVCRCVVEVRRNQRVERGREVSVVGLKLPEREGDGGEAAVRRGAE